MSEYFCHVCRAPSNKAIPFFVCKKCIERISGHSYEKMKNVLDAYWVSYSCLWCGEDSFNSPNIACKKCSDKFGLYDGLGVG